MHDELFDIVDAEDRVVGQAPRWQVHRENWLHRAVSIFVLNGKGELLLQLRTTTKDQYPHCYTSSASGHVDAGEEYDNAAVRELREELQLTGELEFLMKFAASPEMAYEHTALYRLVTDERPVFDPVEIESGEFLPLCRIAEMIAANSQEFTPPFREMFAWYNDHFGEKR